MSKVDVKVCLLGAAGVGKTALIERYINGKFSQKTEPTIGAAFQAKKVVIDGECITLGIWDTAGSERYASLSRIYYRGARGAILCFDATQPSTIESAKTWLEELKQAEPNCEVFLTACKVDELPVSSEVKSLASRIVDDSQFFVTSALTGHGVENLFYAIAERLGSKPDLKATAPDQEERVRLTERNASEQKASPCAC